MSNTPPPLGNSPSGNPNTPGNSPSNNPITQPNPTVVNQAANTANQANAVLTNPASAPHNPSAPVAPANAPHSPSTPVAPTSAPLTPSAPAAPANAPHNPSAPVAPASTPPGLKTRIANYLRSRPQAYRKFKEEHPVGAAVSETTVNAGAALGTGFGIAGTAFVQNSILLGGTLASAGMSAAGPILDGGIDVVKRFGNGKRKRAVEAEWIDYTNKLITSLGSGVSPAELQQLLLNHLQETDGELVNESDEQDLIKALHNCGVFTLADVPPHIENTVKPEVCAKWCVARAAEVCAEALSLHQTNANWKRNEKFSQLSPQEFKSLVDHSDPIKYDHLIQVSVAYARFVSRQRERGKVLGKGIRNVGTGSILSLSTGNPFPIATSLAYEGYKWWSRSQQEKDAFLRINAKGRLVGKDGSEELLNPEIAQREEIFYTASALEFWKAGTDIKNDVEVANYYEQIEHLLRDAGLKGYRDPLKLAAAAQLKLVRNVGKIKEPILFLPKEEKEKLEQKRDSLEGSLATLKGDEAGLEQEKINAEGVILSHPELIDKVIADSYQFKQLSAELKSARDRLVVVGKQITIKKQQISDIEGRLKAINKKLKINENNEKKKGKESHEKKGADVSKESEAAMMKTLDHSHSFEKAFCIWVNNHLEHSPTRTKAIVSGTARNTVARIIGREFKNAVVATGGSAATGAVLGIGGSLIPGLNVVANPGVFASIGAIAGAAGYIRSAAKRMQDGSFFRADALPSAQNSPPSSPPAPPPTASNH